MRQLCLAKIYIGVVVNVRSWRIPLKKAAVEIPPVMRAAVYSRLTRWPELLVG